MSMSEQAKKLRREYMRKWRSKPENKDKNREYQRAYWERKAKEQQAE